MILVDTSVWADHIRSNNEEMKVLLTDTQILIHPFVVGELALGNLQNRSAYLNSFAKLPRAILASDDEVMTMIESKKIFGSGIGYIDAHLLASARLSFAKLWTNDKRLYSVAQAMNLT
jgi:predicted nucleic acid-binding protein